MMGDIAVAVSLFVLLLCAMVIFVAVPVAMMILASATAIIAIILGLWGPDSAKRRTHACGNSREKGIFAAASLVWRGRSFFAQGGPPNRSI